MTNASNTRIVSAAEAGQKLVQYLGRVLGKDVPGSVFMRWIRTGQVRVDGKRAKPFNRVAEGQAVRLPPFASEMAAPKPEAAPAALDLPVLAETADWLVIAKPAGVPVHPGSGWSDSVQTRLNAAFAGLPFVPSIAHRLDRDTSGVLLAARTHTALTRAHVLLAARETDKRYLCWVQGRWTLSAPGEPVVLEDRLEKAGAPGKERVVAGEEGKVARLEAHPLRVEADRALLAVQLFTGRTHQIRAQLASRGHPIVGDAKYGGGKGPMLLHAWRMGIAGETFTCPPPWDGRWNCREDAERAQVGL